MLTSTGRRDCSAVCSALLRFVSSPVQPVAVATRTERTGGVFEERHEVGVLARHGDAPRESPLVPLQQRGLLRSILDHVGDAHPRDRPQQVENDARADLAPAKHDDLPLPRPVEPEPPTASASADGVVAGESGGS